MSEIAVIGAGAWGTAISIVLGRKATHNVRLWAHEPEVCESINARHVNELFLPAALIPRRSCDQRSRRSPARRRDRGQRHALASHPAAVSRDDPASWPEMLFVSATKGIENDSLLRMTEVIAATVRVSGAHWRVERPIVCQGSCRGTSYRHHHRFGRPRAGADGAATNSAIPDFVSTPTKTWSESSWVAR